MKIYISPQYNTNKNSTGNEYLKFFTDSLVNYGWKLRSRYPALGLLNLPFNYDADFYFFHWIDSIERRRFGKIQVLAYIVNLYVLRLLGKKIVWFLHNKQPHTGKTNISACLYKLTARKTDVIITHSNDGVKFIDETFPQYSGKCYCIAHPVYTSEIKVENYPIVWDYVIWGGIEKRKNVLQFITNISSSALWSQKKILICGNCRDLSYAEQINHNLGSNITFVNKYLSANEITEYINKSRAILFTYSSESTLSSGALIYSLNYLKPIIGPRVGSFKEMPGIVTCYDNYEEIPSLEIFYEKAAILDFIRNNTWNSFGKKLEKIFNKAI